MLLLTVAGVFLARSFMAAQPGLQRDEFWALVDASAALPQSVELMYEGQWGHVRPEAKVTPIVYTGRFSYYRDELFRMEVFEISRNCRTTFSYQFGGDFRITSTDPGSRHNQESRAHSEVLLGETRVTQLWMWCHLRALEKEFRSSLLFEGEEEIGGVRCWKVSVGHPHTAPRDKRILAREFWVDASRGCNVLKYNAYMHGRLIERLSGVTLEEFGGDDGKIWVPMEGVVDGFRESVPDGEGKNSVVVRDMPTFRETISVNRTTVRLNGVKNSKQLLVTFAPDDTVYRPSLAKRKPQRPDAEHRVSSGTATQADVQQALATVKKQQTLLQNPVAIRQSPERSWIPWLVGAVGTILVLVAVLLRSRKVG